MFYKFTGIILFFSVFLVACGDDVKEKIAPLGSSVERKLDQAESHFKYKLTSEDRNKIVEQFSLSMPQMKGKLNFPKEFLCHNQ